MNHSEIVSFLWGVADLIRDTFKRGKYQDVILPLTVLRRLDCVLAPTKEKVLRRQAELRDKKLENLDPQLRKASGFAFYNTSRYDFEKLLADAPRLAANLRNYIAGFSLNMREVLEKFDFDNTISKRIPIPDLRTAGNWRIEHPSPDLLETIYLCQRRQAWYRECARSVGEEPRGFVGSVRLDSPIEPTAEEMRRALGFDLDARRECPTWTEGSGISWSKRTHLPAVPCQATTLLRPWRGRPQRIGVACFKRTCYLDFARKG